jgi:hypothetical protein
VDPCGSLVTGDDPSRRSFADRREDDERRDAVVED